MTLGNGPVAECVNVTVPEISTLGRGQGEARATINFYPDIGSMNLTQTTLTDLRDALAQRKLSSVELTRAYLQRIARYDKKFNAFHQVLADRALHRARLADDGRITGPLAGVPVAIKDVLCTDFGSTTCSSKMLADFHAPYTATAVQKLEAAGAIVLGKTNMDEFAMGSSGENCAWGPCCNPWDTARTPGGSSSGSAVAVAADMCAGSLGSDTGGSVRLPAAYCGVVGLKPSYGRVSRYGLVAYASSLDQVGCFGHGVSDVAIMLNAIAGHDAFDSTSAPVPVPDYPSALTQKIEGLRIGLAKQYMSDANHPAVRAMLEQAVAIYREAGAQIVAVDLPHTEYGIPTYYIVATAEASSNLARYDGVRYGHRSPQAQDLLDVYEASRAQGLGSEVKRRIMLGTYVLSSGYYDAYYLRALKVRRLIKQDFDQAFALVDAIVCPTSTGPAFELGAKTQDPLTMYLNDVYTVNCNLAGLPGISLPGGFAEQGGKLLPLGLQLMGPAFAETKLLQIARMYEQATDYHLRRPVL